MQNLTESRRGTGEDLKGKRVLIVDDEYLVRWSLLRTLSSTVKAVFIAKNGLEALDLIKCHSLDLVITDIRMEGMDGFTLIRKARQFKPELRFILLTAYPPQKPISEMKDLGILDIIEKPFDMHAVNELIHFHLRD